MLIRIVTRFENWVVAPLLLAVWRAKGKERLIAVDSGTDRGAEKLGLEPHELGRLKRRAQTEERVLIGEFDQDGLLLSNYGPLKIFSGVTREEFIPRKRFCLRLVLAGGAVGVEKDFRGARSYFVREVTALYRLRAAGCPAPAVLDLDFTRCCLTMSLVRGKVLREELAKAGALVRDRDAEGDPGYRELPAEARRLKRIQAGKELLLRVVKPDFVDQLDQHVRKMHAAGVARLDIKYGNILIEESTGQPRLIDFEQAAPLVRCSKFMFRLLCERDRQEFMLHFGPRPNTRNQEGALVSRTEPVCVG